MNCKEFGRRYIEVIWNHPALTNSPNLTRPTSCATIWRAVPSAALMNTAPSCARCTRPFTRCSSPSTSGDTVAHHWTVTGTHVGEFNGTAATGKPFTLDSINLYRVVGGKLIEKHTVWERWAC